MLLTPSAFAKFAVILLGGASILNGVLILLTARNLIFDRLYNHVVIARGILSILVGSVAVALPLVFAETVLRIIAYSLGGYLVISSLLLSFTALKLRRNGIPVKKSAIEIAVSLFLALLLLTILTLISPERVGMTIIYVFSIILIFSGLSLVILQWIKRPKSAIVVQEQDYEDHPIESTEIAEPKN